MKLSRVFHVYASFFGKIQQVLSGLAEEPLVGYFFWVVVPVPDFDAMRRAVGDDGFPLQSRMETHENPFSGVHSGDLEVVHPRNLQKRRGQLRLSG